MKHSVTLSSIVSRFGRHSIVIACLLFAAPVYAAFPIAFNVSINGVAEVGQTLDGVYIYADLDGDLEGASTYRWLRNNTPIPGATSLQYTLVADDEGRRVRFEVTPVALTGESPGAAVQSELFGPIAPANTAPIASNVNIEGTTEVGFELTGSYNYADADGDIEGASTFRWLRNNNPIPGATGQLYTLVGADEATLIVFEVTPAALTGVTPGLAVQSNAVGPISPANTPPTVSNVNITGTTEVGFQLTGNYDYVDADGDNEGASTFRWLRNNNPIPGAIGQLYTIVDADEGAQIVFEVRPVALTGVSPGLAVQSAPVGPINAANTAPTATAVSVSGVPALGELLTGVYTYNDADADAEGASTYRWLRNGIAIPGANAVSYTLVAADIETAIRFEVTPVAATGVTPGLPVQSEDFQISNSPPTITGQVVIDIPEESPREIVLADLTITDSDSDVFTLTVRDGANYTRSGLNGNIITPILDFNGPLTVPVTVNDGFVDSAVFNLLVTVTPVNDPPVFVGLVQPLITAEDTTLTIVLEDLLVLDPDNVYPADFTLVLTPVLDPTANYTIVGDTSITPTENFNGRLNVGATVSDGELTSLPFVIAVDVDPVNDLPVLVAPIGPNNAIEDAPFNLNISANFADADGEALSYAVEYKVNELPVAPPPNIAFDTITGIFSGTPRLVDTEAPGPVYQVTVTALDPFDEFVSDTFVLTISALGRANLGLSISVTPDTALPSDDLRWTITSRNPVGPVAGANVELTGSFVGSGLTVSVEGTANCTIEAEVNQVTAYVCVLGALPVGASTNTVITTATSQASEVIAFATVAGTEIVPIDPNLDDNSDFKAVGVAEAFSVGAVQNLGNSRIRSVAAGDVNGDGKADLVVGTAAGQSVQVYFNDAPREPCQCQRDFLSAPISVPDTGSNEGVALADFDNNGSLDLVIANGGGQADRVYSNDGAGNFTPMATLDPTFAQDVAVGDFDNDGDMDIAIAAIGGNPVYLGNGNGGFNLHDTLGNSNSAAVAVARFDSGNLDDLVFANVAGSSAVWTKNAGAGFTRRDQLNIGDAVAVAAADLNGDNRADLVFGRVPTIVGKDPKNPEAPSNPVLINDGSGRFGNPSALLGISPTNDVHIGDVNQDGVLDLVFIGASGVHQIWTANGGGYTLHREQIIDSGAVAGVLVELGDTDSNDPGGVDLAMGGEAQGGLGVYLNDGFGNLGRGDAVPPTVALIGEAALSVSAKSTYRDAGATAEDNIDGNISARVTASGSVNTSVVGTYVLTYNVVDFAGNPATPITRTVTVTPASGGGGGGGGTISYITLLSLLLGLMAMQWYRAIQSTPQQKVV